MKPSELTELMYAVLDGEATTAEVRALERHLAADAEARAEFDSLRALFDELKGLPQGISARRHGCVHHGRPSVAPTFRAVACN